MGSVQVEVDEIRALVERVRAWPIESRVELAQGILETLRGSSAEASRKRTGDLRNLLGLLSTTGAAPSDEEIDQILEEELLRKYGS